MPHDPWKDATVFANFSSGHVDLDLMASSSKQPMKFRVQVKSTRSTTLAVDPPPPTSSSSCADWTSGSDMLEYNEHQVDPESESPVEIEVETADSEYEEIEVED